MPATDPWGFYEREWHEKPESRAFLEATAAKDAARDLKWAEMTALGKGGLAGETAVGWRRRRLMRRVRKGVPREWRAAAWPGLLAANGGHGPEEFRQAARRKGITYGGLCARGAGPPAPGSIFEVIERDLTRTYPRHARFETAVINGGRSAGGADEAGGVAALRRLLRAYATLDEVCGYCQGMNYVGALLLVHGHHAARSQNDPSRSLGEDAEEACFWLFVACLRGPRTKLRELYLPSMVGCRRALAVYGGFLAKLRPALSRHFLAEGLAPTMYATHWFVTVFCAQFPSALVARVWDQFLIEGWKPVYKVAVALLACNERELLALDFEGLMAWLRQLPETVDVEKTLKVAATLRVTDAAVRDLEAKFQAEEAVERKDL